MPNLPTFNVTDAQSTRILDAYKARYGTTTTAETVTAFRKWLAGEVRQVVEAHEARLIDEQNNTAKRDKLAAVRDQLPDPESVT